MPCICCNKETHPKLQARCSKCIRVTIVTFLIFNCIWGISETLIAMVVNFLVNHPVGDDGFTDSNLKIRDITFLEHQEWELESEAPFREVTPEQQYMKDLRDWVTQNCSKPVEEDSNTVVDDKCNERIADDNEGIYFCDIVENPEIFRAAFRPLVRAWMIFNFMYLATCPLSLLAIMWRTRRTHVFVIYCVLQIIPMFTSFMIVVLIRTSFKNYNYVLCSLDYLFDLFPTRTYFTLFTIGKIFLKLIEIGVIACHICEIRAEKESKGYSARQKNRNRVAPISTIRSEVLQSSNKKNVVNELNEPSRSDSRMSFAPLTVVNMLKKNALNTDILRRESSRKSRVMGRKRSIGSVPTAMQASISLNDFEDEDDDDNFQTSKFNSAVTGFNR